MDNESRQNQNQICGKKNIIVLLGIVYLSTLIYGLILLKNNQWTSNNYMDAILIYCIIIVFDLSVWAISIRYNLCILRENSQNESSSTRQWYEILDLNEITRVIKDNFQITEGVISEEITDSNSSDSMEMKTCIICNNEYIKIDENNIRYIKLECNHDFCEDCISKWCNKKNSCPMCRKEIINKGHLINNSSNI